MAARNRAMAPIPGDGTSGASRSLTGADRHRTRAFAALLTAFALLVAACGATVEPITSFVPSATPVPPTAVPSQGRFRAAAYPADGDAPCGQAEAPDASHAPYRGEFKRISATDAETVVFELCGPDVAFRSKIAAPAFAINDAGWLTSHIDPGTNGPQAIVEEVNGTGPYRLERWSHGSEVSLARNDRYWGDKALNERLIVRWYDNAGQRIAELQNASVDGVDDLDPTAVPAVLDDTGLALTTRPGLNVSYLGFNNTFAPFDNERVRQAIAMGIDRQHIVDTYFPPGSELATHYTPCGIPHGCTGDPWYEYDPILGKEMLAAAGFPDGFDTKIQYSQTPTATLPDPTGVANELKNQLLANLGIRAELVSVPEDTFLADIEAGKVDGIHLLGQSPTLPDATAFLDPRFGPAASAEFGAKFDDIRAALAAGESTTGAKRDAAYAKANNAIQTHVPMIPIARTASNAAFRADVTGAAISPLRLERFAAMTPGDRRQLVWLTTAEPAGLYCADETDAVSDMVCAQLGESLYGYDPTSAATVPSLAKGCDPDDGLTVWTCTLRSGVTFHDGQVLDANDVVLTFAAQWDAEHKLHRGRDGRFAPFAGLFGGFLNAPASPGG
jgi:peptide/nickel transport system substrate-binding protein